AHDKNVTIRSLVAARGPQRRERREHIRREHALVSWFVAPKKSQIQISHASRLLRTDNGRFHAAGRIGEIGAKQSRARQINGGAQSNRDCIHPLEERSDSGIGGRAKLKTEKPVKAELL